MAMFAVYNASTNSVMLVPGTQLFTTGGSPVNGSTPASGQSGMQQTPHSDVRPQGLAAMGRFLDSAELLGSSNGVSHLAYSQSDNTATRGFQAPSHTGKRSQEQTSDDDFGPGAYKRQSNGGTEAMDSKEKNKLAQRRFRARQKGLVSELEKQIQEMTLQAIRHEQELNTLRQENNKLKLQATQQAAPVTPQGTGEVARPDHTRQVNGSPSPAQSLDVSSWTPLPIYDFVQQGGQCQQLDQQAYTTLTQHFGATWVSPVVVAGAPGMTGTSA